MIQAQRAACLSAAQAGAEVLLRYFRKLDPGAITEKTKNDYVSNADREAEAAIRAVLASLFPDYGFLGEESGGSGRRDILWIVDPLDGTNNFAAGKPPFGILVALSQGGETIGGWIYDVLSGRFCHARSGEGAFVNGEQITARTSGETPPIAAVSVLFADPVQREALLTQIAPHYRMVDIPRCAAEQYPRLALGINDLSVFERTLAWDHAAGVLVLNEAGGKAARKDGSPYRVDEDRKGMIAAANPALWDELAARMAAI
jgi:fructose-1,6-bisphosphatase/inositol monophosphatase family enzyme